MKDLDNSGDIKLVLINEQPKDYLFLVSIGMIVVASLWLLAWSNHFQNSFHFDDMPSFVANESVHHIANIPRFFIDPRLSSVTQESAVYRPLLTSWFAIDYSLVGSEAIIYQSESFAWFIAQLVVMFFLFRLIPGVSEVAAGFATLLFGLHPVTADTVNYVLQRGSLMGAFGLLAGLLIWVVWPWKFPQRLPVKVKPVPVFARDAFWTRYFTPINNFYLKILHAPSGLHLWPVVLGMLCHPATAAFAPILYVYIVLFETKRKTRNAVPAAIVCGGYWILHFVLTWRMGGFSRISALNYWFTQPWVAIRYLYKFFVPTHLSADTDLAPFAHFWHPLAIAGYLGVAALVRLAIVTSRSARWRTVSFGIWWFLLALVPDALLPQRAVEADWRMFLPFIGLALAVARIATIFVIEPLEKSAHRLEISIAAGTLAAGLLAVLGWATYERSAVWETEETLWIDVMANSPNNARAVMNYALTPSVFRDPGVALDFLSRAADLSPHDPVIEINLAQGYGRLSREKQAEGEFQRAESDAPSFSPVYSSYAAWLFSEDRLSEAYQMASKAVALDPYDSTGRRALMDIMTATHNWGKLRTYATETLGLLPDDLDGLRGLRISQSGFDQIHKAETEAKTQPSADRYLALSVHYFQTERYEDCINTARAALKINPNLAEAYANIASAYHTMGKLDETIAALQEEVRLNPNLPSAQKNLEIELALKKEKSGR